MKKKCLLFLIYIYLKTLVIITAMLQTTLSQRVYKAAGPDSCILFYSSL